MSVKKGSGNVIKLQDMRWFKRFLTLVLTGSLLMLLASCSKKVAIEKADDLNMKIYPVPQQLRLKDTMFALPPKVGLVVPKNLDAKLGEALKNIARAHGVSEFKTYEPGDRIRTDVTIYLNADVCDAYITGQLESIAVTSESVGELPAEGYVLAIGHTSKNAKKIIIAGKDEDGVFYGIQTLSQVLMQTGNGKVAEVVIKDYPKMQARGIIEGFYGTPWTKADRISQIRFLAQNKMNTYVYAPKDDPFHRDQWRISYPEEKLMELKELNDVATENHVDFVFTVSPGLDICYASDDDFRALLNKAEMLYYFGVRHFAILLDDITQNLHCSRDRDMFDSSPSPFAAAQAYLLNRFNDEFVKTHEGVGRLTP
jgi:hyaluronoglucosaminidase